MSIRVYRSLNKNQAEDYRLNLMNKMKFNTVQKLIQIRRQLPNYPKQMV